MCTTPNLYGNSSLPSLVGHYQRFIKGFACIEQLLNKLLSGEGASRKLEWVSLPEGAMRAFDAMKWTCMSTPVLAFADYTKEFLLKTNASKEGLETVLSQNRQMDSTTQLPMVAEPLHLTRKNTFYQTLVCGAKMGGQGTLQGVLTISTLLS